MLTFAEAEASAPAHVPAIDTLFRHMCEVGASDLHLTSGMPPLVRKDGEMRPLYQDAGPYNREALTRLLMEITPAGEFLPPKPGV